MMSEWFIKPTFPKPHETKRLTKKLNETEHYYCTKEKHEIYNRT